MRRAGVLDCSDWVYERLRGVAKTEVESVLGLCQRSWSLLTAADISRALAAAPRGLAVRAVLGYGGHGPGAGLWSDGIYKTLKEVHPDTQASPAGLAILNDFVTDCLQRVLSNALLVQEPIAGGSYKLAPIAGEVPATLAYSAEQSDLSKTICAAFAGPPAGLQAPMAARAPELGPELGEQPGLGSSKRKSDGASAPSSESKKQKASASINCDEDDHATAAKASERDAILALPAIVAATRNVLPREISKHAISEGTKALDAFRTTAAAAGWSTKHHLGVAAIAAVGGARARCTLTGEAAVFLSAVLEYLAFEVLELAGNACKDLKERDIRPRHILLAVRGDEELDTLLRDVVIREGGVVPYIQRQHLGLSAPSEAASGPRPPTGPSRWEVRFRDMVEASADKVLVDPRDGLQYYSRHGYDAETDAEIAQLGAFPTPRHVDRTAAHLAALEALSIEDRGLAFGSTSDDAARSRLHIGRLAARPAKRNASRSVSRSTLNICRGIIISIAAATCYDDF